MLIYAKKVDDDDNESITAFFFPAGMLAKQTIYNEQTVQTTISFELGQRPSAQQWLNKFLYTLEEEEETEW